MKPAKFEYVRPVTLEEAIHYLEQYGDDAKVISGGQSLIPLLSMRLSTPKYLIDLNRIQELKYIREEEDVLAIGALTRHAEVERSALVQSKCPLLTEAARYIGHKQIRNRGTVGGSIAHADPTAEWPCVISALRGEIVIIGPEGERTVGPDEFFLTYLLTSLDRSEIVKEVRFPYLPPSSGYAFVEVARRHGDFGLVEVAAAIDLDENGLISYARLAVGGASPVPCVLVEVEEALIGEKPSEALFAAVTENVKDLVDPEGDIHGTAEYRRHLAAVMTKRALQEASEKCGGGVRVE